MNIQRFLALCTLGLFLTNATNGTLQIAGMPSPRLLIFQHDHKNSEDIIFWDCPVFAEYENGEVIWRKSWRSSIDALTTTKGRAAIDELRAIESVFLAYHGRVFKLTDFTDPIVTRIWIAGRTLEIWGDWEKPRDVTGSAVEYDSIERINKHELALWRSLPDDLRCALLKAKYFHSIDEMMWRPERILLTLYRPTETNLEPIPWPSEWPKEFKKMPESQSKYIELTGSMLDELHKRLVMDGVSRPIVLNEETRRVGITIVFPGDVARFAW